MTEPVVCKQCGTKIADTVVGSDVHHRGGMLYTGSDLLMSHLERDCPRIEQLLDEGRRPFPASTTTLPACIRPLLVPAVSAIPYEGEPRREMRLLVKPQPQLWAPFWVDIVATVSAVWIDVAGSENHAARLVKRNQLFEEILKEPKAIPAIMAAYRLGDYEGAAGAIRALFGWYPVEYLSARYETV